MLISSILKRAIELYPDTEAISSGKVRFTYRQFGERVHKLANYFVSEGLGKGDCVAILHNNSHEFLEVYFAAAQIGAILNPLNFRLSPRELAFILNDSGSNFLIASKRYRESVESLKALDIQPARILWTGHGEIPRADYSEEYESVFQNQPPGLLPEPDISENDIAHLYYTSGTTGLPKGVALTHKNVTFHSLAVIAELGINDRDVWVHVAPLFHLADAWATFAITWVGGRHVTVPDFEPIEVFESIQREKVTLSNMIPTMLNMLVNTPGMSKYNLSSLRVILSGGAPIAPELVRKIMDTFKCDYIQTYGMTETSPYVTLTILKKHLQSLPVEEQFEYKAMTGRPLIGVGLKVVRPDGKEILPDGREVGEIIVRGDTITPGYWNRPEETQKVFEEGWLYTGDLAVRNNEGYVNIVDRKKDMIVTGGENVYSTEVENVLYKHPDILEAAVIGVPDPHWGEAIKACVVLKEGRHLKDMEVIEFCKQDLASYKAPKTVVFLQTLPKTGSGKIFKKGLKEKYAVA